MQTVLPLSRLLPRRGFTLYRPDYHSRWLSTKVLQKFKLADIGEGITECEVIKWNVKEETRVQEFDPLCEVQSDKASVEVTSPFDGIVKELLVKEGEVAKVGEGLCLIEVEEEVAESTLDASSSMPGGGTEQTQSLTGTSVEERGVSDAVSQAETSREEPAIPAPRRVHPMDPNYIPDSSTKNAKDVLATPSVRHFAKQKGVNLADVAPGSGRDGRVEKKDVEAHSNATTGGKMSSVGSVSPTHTTTDVVVELGRTRYGMWKAMVKSLEIPHFGYTASLDITELHHILPSLNAHLPAHYRPPPTSPPPPSAVDPSALYPAPSPATVPVTARYTRLTYLPVLLKTLSKAMIEWPILRSSITPGSASTDSTKPTLTIRPHADISIAFSTPTGLYTPTIQRVDTHSIYSLGSHLKQLAHLGRQIPCALTPADMPKRGGTLTVSNVGAIGAGESAAPVLVPGGGIAIVAIGRAKWVWDVDRGDGKGERRLKLGVSWSADHRVLEGAELAAFVECWRLYVETPAKLIGEGV